MHPLVKLTLAWLVTTGLAVALGVVAVGVVTDSVTQDRPERLSALGVRDALIAEETPVDPSATTTTTPTAGQPAATGTSGPAATGPRVTSPTPTSPATTPTTNPPATTPTTNPPGTTASTTQNTTATTTPGATFPPPEDRTYQLVGGTVGVRFENGGARLLWATPKPGFSVESSSGGDDVDVRFRSDDHESRLKAFWDNGPQSDVEERDR
ncbi:MAG: hypothetical protein ACRDZ3_22905 [Acidimicrobiia bacterium]